MDLTKWAAEVLANSTASAVAILTAWATLRLVGYQVRIVIEPRVKN